MSSTWPIGQTDITILRELVRLYVDPAVIDDQESVFRRTSRVRRELARVEEAAFLQWCEPWRAECKVHGLLDHTDARGRAGTST